MDLRERKTGSRRHPWELARLGALDRILAAVPVDARTRVMDVGCGDGFAGGELFRGRPCGEVIGVDPELTDKDISELRRRYRHTYVRRPDELAEPHVDLLLLLDILEHVEGDQELLQRLVADHVAPGGHAMITVPAFDSLYSAHDRFLLHVRRYDSKRLGAMVARAGLQVLRGGFLFGSLLPLRVLSVGLQRMVPTWQPAALGAGGWRGSGLFSRAVELALRADNRLLLALAAAGVKLPGLTIWTLCRKP